MHVSVGPCRHVWDTGLEVDAIGATSKESPSSLRDDYCNCIQRATVKWQSNHEPVGTAASVLDCLSGRSRQRLLLE